MKTIQLILLLVCIFMSFGSKLKTKGLKCYKSQSECEEHEKEPGFVVIKACYAVGKSYCVSKDVKL